MYTFVQGGSKPLEALEGCLGPLDSAGTSRGFFIGHLRYMQKLYVRNVLFVNFPQYIIAIQYLIDAETDLPKFILILHPSEGL